MVSQSSSNAAANDEKPWLSGNRINGRVSADAITPERIYAVVCAYIKWMAEETGKDAVDIKIAVGRDARIASAEMAEICIAAVFNSGAVAADYQIAPTPVIVTQAALQMCDGAISVTSGLSDADGERHCGLKLFCGTLETNTKQMKEILARMQAHQDISKSSDAHAAVYDANAAYFERIYGYIRDNTSDVQYPLLGLHVLVDAAHGGGGIFSDILEELGAWIENSRRLEQDAQKLPRKFDSKQNLKEISAAVCAASADIGLMFDYDCARVVIVDDSGELYTGNRLIALLAAIHLEEHPNTTIVTDLLTSSGLQQFITEWGGVHYRFKIGYRDNIDEALRLNSKDIDCPLMAETSGRAAFRENNFVCDGFFTSGFILTKLIQLRRNGQKLMQLLDGLREPVERAQLRLPITDVNVMDAAWRVITCILSHANEQQGWHIAEDNRQGAKITLDIDGGLDNAWFLIRLSIHDPEMPLNIESDVTGGVKMIARMLLTILYDTEGINISKLEDMAE